MPGLLTDGAFDDKFLACDRCGIGGGGPLGERVFKFSTFSIPLTLGLIGNRPLAILFGGRDVSALLSLRRRSVRLE